MRAALALAGAVFVFAAEGAAATTTVFWAKSYAEGRVESKLRVPCRVVFSASTCNLAKATRDKAEFAQKLNACNARSSRALINRCVSALAHSPLATAKARIGYIRNGLPVRTATCIGTGNPDKRSHRFSRFRCVILIEDTKTRRDAIAYRTITVIVTGKTTFRWRLI